MKFKALIAIKGSQDQWVYANTTKGVEKSALKKLFLHVPGWANTWPDYLIIFEKQGENLYDAGKWVEIKRIQYKDISKQDK